MLVSSGPGAAIGSLIWFFSYGRLENTWRRARLSGIFGDVVMRLTTKGQYAVRAMVGLACHGGDSPVTLKDISDGEGISQTYLEQLFVKLRKGGLVRSVRGPGGGYVLTRSAAEISVCDVIEVVEEPLNPVSCLDDVPTDCEKFNRCATKKVWQGLGNRIKEFLSSVSIEELSIDAHSFDEDSGSGKTNKEDSVCTHPPS